MEEATGPKEAAGPFHLLRAERGCGGGLDKHSFKGGLALQQEQLEGMREKQRLKWPSFSSGTGGSWHRWKGSAQEAFSLQGELRTVEGVETSSLQQAHQNSFSRESETIHSLTRGQAPFCYLAYPTNPVPTLLIPAGPR